MNIHYLWWIPAVGLMYVWQAWLSTKVNVPNSHWKYFAMLWVAGCIPLWTVVAKVTQNMMFDALLYDLVMFVAFSGALMQMGVCKGFTFLQWFGLCMCLSGFIMIKIGVAK